MTLARAVLALLLSGALVAVAAGCAGGSSSSAAPVATDHVDLPPSYRFDPVAITVTAGTTVTWTNRDNFSHSVQFDGEAAPGLVMAPGDAVTRAFPTAGTFPYVCTFHSQDMKGTVVVTAG